MIQFVKGIYHDQAIKISKMLADLSHSSVNKDIDPTFLQKTVELLTELRYEILSLIDSGDLDVEQLASNNIIKYNTFHERLLSIELFRYLVIMNYGEAEMYFKRKIIRIYSEIDCFFQKPPLITTISNSENYYWALPSYDIIAVPTGEERNLLNLPDLYHEVGHLIYNQYSLFLKGTVERSLHRYYQSENQRVLDEQRDPKLISFFREKMNRWKNGWTMEFTCDLIATYLVGPAYAWTNLKLTTLSSGKFKIYKDSPSHPSDESRMRAIIYMLDQTGYGLEGSDVHKSWNRFLDATNNPIPQNYEYIFPSPLIEELARNVLKGCESIGLRSYAEQISKFGNPISKILNDAWKELFDNPANFEKWEADKITEIAAGERPDAEVLPISPESY